jgi:hypothetical protein
MKFNLISAFCFVPMPTWMVSIDSPCSFVWYALGSIPGEQPAGSQTQCEQNAKNI